MTDLLLTSIVPIALLIIALWGNKRSDSDRFFLNKDYTTWLKGLCAIVVIMIHFSGTHVNKLQDAIGSFAFVAVTIFFLFSAYGMQLSAEKKPGYLRNFWRNRLVALLTPCLVVNLLAFGYSLSRPEPADYSRLYLIDGYVLVLLQYCLLFYIVMKLQGHYKWKSHWVADGLLIAGVIAYSLFLYFHDNKDPLSVEIGWCYERYGLIWGLLLFRFFPSIVKWLNTRRLVKTLITLVACMVVGVAYLKLKSVPFTGGYCLKVALGAVIILLIMLLTQKRTFGNKVSTLLGTISYEIYLSHGFVMHVLDDHAPGLGSGLFVLATVACTIVLSYGIHYIDSKIVKTLRA